MPLQFSTYWRASLALFEAYLSVTQSYLAQTWGPIAVHKTAVSVSWKWKRTPDFDSAAPASLETLWRRPHPCKVDYIEVGATYARITVHCSIPTVTMEAVWMVLEPSPVNVIQDSQEISVILMSPEAHNEWTKGEGGRSAKRLRT